MKIRFCAALLLAAFVLTAFAGCSTQAAEGRLDALEDTVENGLEAAKDTIESALTPSTHTDTGTTAASTVTITKEEAVSIALADAGLTAEDVTGLRSHYDADGKVAEYDVEFHHNGMEYDYEIDAASGVILKAESEPEKEADHAAATASSGSTKLSKEEAQEIALKDAGLTADQVTGLRVEYDADGKVAEYDVEFHHSGWEYDYEINADTGEIISYDREKND